MAEMIKPSDQMRRMSYDNEERMERMRKENEENLGIIHGSSEALIILTKHRCALRSLVSYFVMNQHWNVPESLLHHLPQLLCLLKDNRKGKQKYQVYFYE
ncbi:hypothetical protein JHK87_006703 [Glycine soja]|nr:hypothetical protein JHK87_006703 [Glycine soja]